LEAGKEAFVYSLFYVYFEQYTYVKGIAIQNVLLAVGVVYAAVLVIFFHFCLNYFRENECKNIDFKI
jgi:hypothetical protein